VKLVDIVVTVVPVQPQTCTAASFKTNPSSLSVAALTTDYYPEYKNLYFTRMSIR